MNMLILFQGPTSVTVEIHLLDTNDNSPAFLPSEYLSFYFMSQFRSCVSKLHHYVKQIGKGGNQAKFT